MLVHKKTVASLIIFFIVFSSSILVTAQQKTDYTESQLPVVLLTGFGPFHSYEVNPSELIVQNLSGEIINDAVLVGIILPVDFEKSVEEIIQAIQHYEPVLIFSLGLSAASTSIEVETFGINLKRSPLNEEGFFFPRRINLSGPFLQRSTFNTRDIVFSIRDEGIAVKQSFFAGMYICNTVLYQTIGYIKTHNLNIKSGFIHVPLLDTQHPEGMPLEFMSQAIRIAIQTSIP